MTDPNQPFQRPQPFQSPRGEPMPSGEDGAPAVGDPSAPPPPRIEPLILDPEFHQSVWTPWEHTTGTPSPSLSNEVDEQPSARAGQWKVRGTTLITAAAALALGAVLLLPPLLHTPTWPQVPLVEDLTSTPEVAWSADGGQKCLTELDQDHAVMADDQRVWSLDLRDGRTAWSVNMAADELRLSCLPGANMVAVTVVDGVLDEVIRIALLDGSTGRTMTEFLGDETVQVIPLGANIGLLDRSNMLRAVRPSHLGDPLWSQRLPGVPGNLTPIHVQRLDDASVQLWYSSGTDAALSDDVFMPVMSLSDGELPPWCRAAGTDTQFYARMGDVVLWSRPVEEGLEVSVLDLTGRELWSFEDAEPTVSGSRLYTASPGDSISEPDVRELREVDPRSGQPLSDDVFAGTFDHVVAAPQGRVAVFETGALTILDENMQAQTTIRDVDYGGDWVGEKLLYTGGNMQQDSNARRTRLTAIDPSTARVVWDFYVDPGQRIVQMGRHLIVVDNGGKTLQGLKSST